MQRFRKVSIILQYKILVFD